MRMRKLLALVLTVIMVMLILPMTISAEDTVTPISECGGVIKSGATYSISTAEEFLMFEEMNDKCSGATIILTNDITIHDGIFSVDENQKPLYNGTFVLPEPIESIDSFYGTFDGRGYAIYGLYINDELNAGLVGTLDGTIKNISVENSLIIGNGDVGSICGDSSYSSKVEKCFSSAIVTGNPTYIGGISGDFGGTMTDCFFYGTVISDKTVGDVGGVVGMAAGTFINCANAGDVYGYKSDNIGGFAGFLAGSAQGCSNTGDVYANYVAAGFAGYVIGECKECFAAGEVYAKLPSNFMSYFVGYPQPSYDNYYPDWPSLGGELGNMFNPWSEGFYDNFKGCCFIARYGDTADYNGDFDEDYQRYLDSIVPDLYGMGQIVDDQGLQSVSEDVLKKTDKYLWIYHYSDFVVDTGNENKGYPIAENLQRRTVAPSITNVEYEKSFDTRNTFTVTVEGRPAMIQFIEPTNGTRTYDRNHKNVTIKSYDADGNEVNSLDRTAAYEVWSTYSNMMANVEIRTRAKYLSDAKYTWDSETYDFSMILANPIVSMELSATSGKKGPVPATVVADEKTEKVMFKMPNGTSVTVSSTSTDENGNKIFTGKAWMNEDGLNEIKVKIYRKNVWKTVGTLEYTAS